MTEEEEESTFSSLAEETEIDRCRDYVVTKAAFIRKKKKKEEKISYMHLFV